MKIPMEAITLLSVLFATSSILAIAADDTQQDRQLRPKKSKKKKKLRKIFNNIETKKLRIVLDSPPTVLSAVAGGGPGGSGPSFIGSRAIITGRAFSRSSVTIDGEAGDNTSKIAYSQICTVTTGAFPAVETTNCDFSLCFTEPLIGGCAFYKSDGIYPYDSLIGILPQVTATKTGGTGVIGFDTGPAFFILSSPGSGQVQSSPGSRQVRSSPGSVQVLDLDLTILPRENTIRNKIFANTVPGFCPPEAGGDLVCIGGFGEKFNMP